MAFYSLKSIVPVRVPVRNETELTYRNLDQKEQVNLLDRHFLIKGAKPEIALQNFFSIRNEPDDIFGIVPETNLGFNIALMPNVVYLVTIQSNKKTSFFLYTPTYADKEIIFNEVDINSETIKQMFDVQEITPALLRDKLSVLDSPLDQLVKLRKSNEIVVQAVRNYMDNYDHKHAQPRFMAHAVKAIRNDWILQKEVN